MIGIVLTGHGQFASGLFSSLTLIAGGFENVVAVDFNGSDSTEDLTEKLEAAVKKISNWDRVIFLTDLVGGSPFKSSVLVGQALKESRVIAGANLPMVLEVAFASGEDDIEVLKNIALEVGKSGIKCFGDEPRVKKVATGARI